MLIETLYHLSEKFTDNYKHIIPILIDTLYTSHEKNAINVLSLLKFHMEANSGDKKAILSKLLNVIEFIPNLKFFRRLGVN